MNIQIEPESYSDGSNGSDMSDGSNEFDKNILDEFKNTIEGFQPAIEEIAGKIQEIQNKLEDHGSNWFTQKVQPNSSLKNFWKFYNLPEILEFNTLLSTILSNTESFDMKERTITFRDDDLKFFGSKTITVFDFIPQLVQGLRFLE